MLLPPRPRERPEIGGTDRGAAENALAWVRTTYDLDETPETNQDYRVARRVFGKRTTGEGEVPPGPNGRVQNAERDSLEEMVTGVGRRLSAHSVAGGV